MSDHLRTPSSIFSINSYTGFHHYQLSYSCDPNSHTFSFYMKKLKARSPFNDISMLTNFRKFVLS